MFYTQIVFISSILEIIFYYAHLLEDFYIVHDHIDASFLLLLQKHFYIAPEYIGAFCLFLLQKDFGTVHVLLFEAFLCFF